MALVLSVSYSGALGGAERVLLEFASALEGHEVCVACPEGGLADAARAAGWRWLPLRSRPLEVRKALSDRALSTARLMLHGAEVRRLERDLDPDVVIACGMRSALALILVPGRRGGTPVVFEHGDMLPGPWIARAVRAAAARADLVVVPSRAVAADIGETVRALVIHPGIDVRRFDSAAATPPVEPPEVLVLGAIVEWKRIDVALEALAVARRMRPELRLRLRIVGGPLGREVDALEGDALVARLRARASLPDLAGAVAFAGPVSDVSGPLARSSCLLHCAEREPFGLVVAEALAAGRPAVVPDAGGPAEIVDDGCGVRYTPGDSDAAGRALLDVLADREHARRMGERGRDRARARFGAARARREFADAVEPMIRRRPATAVGSLALLTVTHNSAADLGALLGSVQRHLPGARVVVVDSGSSDDSVAVARRSPAAAVISLAENVGFGRACNEGLRQIEEPLTALVNPDVELLDDSLAALALEASRPDRPERLLAPLVLAPDGSRQDSAHPRPLSLADLVRAVIPPAALAGRVGVPLAPWRAGTPRVVGWAVGCALVARTETLRSLGPFDERIFLYGEDLDLGLRAAELGVRTWFWPSARVLHHGAHATLPAFGGEPFEMLARARHDVLVRHLGPRRARIDDAVQATTFISRIALKRALGRSAARERRQLAALARGR
jgi:glycosyltransferase involved in cell wall biosynthesis/GT2 family glycosyltransferase